MARRAVSRAARVRAELAGAGRRAEAPRAALRAARPGSDVLRAKRSGTRRPVGWRATTSRSAASARTRAGHSDSGSRSAVTRSPGKRWAKGFTREELRAAGLTRQRGDDYFSRRLLLPARRCARAGGRLPGAPFVRRRPVAGEVREHTRIGALPQRFRRLRARQGASRDRAGGSRVHRRGQHRRDRPAPGRARAGCREHGHRADRGPVEGARAAEQAALARIRRRRCGGDGDAARDGARGEAGLRRQKRWRCLRASTRPTTRAGSSSGSPAPIRTCSTACGSRSSGPRIARRRFASCCTLLDEGRRLTRASGCLAATRTTSSA